MKIGILTQPLLNNYGGIIQAYALQTVLQKMGHQTLIIDRHHRDTPLWLKGAVTLKRLVDKCLPFRGNCEMPFWPSRALMELISEKPQEFVAKYIDKTSPLYTHEEMLKVISQHKFEAFIVGSDQVWRPFYSPRIATYYLDFLMGNKMVKKIAYAASFGVDGWEYSERDQKVCAQAAKLFDHISVRENSAVRLCEQYLGVGAEQVLDPTMLLNKADYIKIINDNKEHVSVGNLMTYILDTTPQKRAIISLVEQTLGLTSFSTLPQRKLSKDAMWDIDTCKYPSEISWLRGFLDAEFVVVDSFHGCVFSILFNIPFLAIGNNGRGMTRFESLLQKFHLEDRLIDDNTDMAKIKELVCVAINFKEVNEILEAERNRSIEFLSSALLN